MGLDKKEYFYITTPIYYINDEPHIGHFYCTTAADILARYHRLIGDEVFFVTGTDENSLKTLQAAEKFGMAPKEFTDKMASKWKKTWEELNISFDYFVRTTSEEHKKSVEKLLMRCYNANDIYKKEYEGFYCVGCEKFLLDDEIVDGKCPIHKTKPEWIKEENYFFRLSKYSEKILELLQKEDFALPEARRNEMIEFVKKGLKDISISRAKINWGIPVPFDNSQVVYVWFDALINYITALEFYKDKSEKFDKFWENAIHLVGKDIFRFHTIMWPAMLFSANIKPPKQVFGHGFFTINGEKISKSLGNVINPVELAKKYGIDPLRYYIMREIPFGKDSDFSISRLEERYKNDLANDLGNLINRSINMLIKYNNSKIPKPDENLLKTSEHIFVKNIGENLIFEIDKSYKNFEFSQILEKIMEFTKSINKYIDKTKPWQLKKENKIETLNTVLYNIFSAIKMISLFIYPFMPQTAQKIYNQIGEKNEVSKQNYQQAIKFGSLSFDRIVGEPEILFPPLN